MNNLIFLKCQGISAESKEHVAESKRQKQLAISYAFLGQLCGVQAAESRVNTGSLPGKCQKGSATEYSFSN
jgi:hypothetical protein